MNTANHTARLALAALSALTGLALSTHVAYGANYDTKYTGYATGPAGSITYSPGEGSYFYGFRYMDDPRTYCERIACVSYLYPTSLEAQGDSLVWGYDAKEAYFGPTVYTYTIIDTTYTDHNNPSLVGSTLGNYGVVATDLVDLAHTQFTLTFKGTSDTPNQTLDLSVEFNKFADQALALSRSFTQDGNTNWEISLDLPVGYDLGGKSLHYALSATNGKHFLSSMTITPHLVGAVPEASTLALMGLGLVGLAWARRQGRTH
jgi:hypothetical protein